MIDHILLFSAPVHLSAEVRGLWPRPTIRVLGPPPRRHEWHNRSPNAYFAVTGEALVACKRGRVPRVAFGSRCGRGGVRDAGVGTNTVPWGRCSEKRATQRSLTPGGGRSLGSHRLCANAGYIRCKENFG